LCDIDLVIVNAKKDNNSQNDYRIFYSRNILN